MTWSANVMKFVSTSFVAYLSLSAPIQIELVFKTITQAGTF